MRDWIRLVTRDRHSPPQRLFGFSVGFLLANRKIHVYQGRFKEGNGLTGGVPGHVERIGILNCKRARKDGKREKERRSLCQITCGSMA